MPSFADPHQYTHVQALDICSLTAEAETRLPITKIYRHYL